MNERFLIDFEWLTKDFGENYERVTFAEIVIRVNGLVATHLEDAAGKTTRQKARLSAYDFAMWLTYNWWRLLWEPERPDSLSWKMSHMVGSIGSGYLWPDLRFSSDGAAVTITSNQTSRGNREPIRYLNDFVEVIPVKDFKDGIQAFINSVIARLVDEGIKDTELSALWQEVCEETWDRKKKGHFRKLESIMGFDPGEAPDALMNKLQVDEKIYGSSATEEMIALERDHSCEAASILWHETKRQAEQIKIPDTATLREQILKDVDANDVTWKQAEVAANIVRKKWALDDGPIETKQFCGLLGISEEFVQNPASIRSSISAGFRNGDTDGVSIFINTPYPANRRFAMARLIGDHLRTSDKAEKLLPVTDVQTMRQTFQRKFAQEFLCPFSDLNAFLGGKKPTDEIIDNAAENFGVSPLAIKTTLVNKGRLDRKSLFELR